ncbi:MAG: SseB family protein, partial [Nocardiopsaceae bacterium]|nr:SseB family protein [Nocardiopsaceae bacterium]
VRPGAIAWGGVPGEPGNASDPAAAGPMTSDSTAPGATAPGATAPADAACEVVEKALAAMIAGGDPDDLLDELTRGRIWIPLPGGPGPVTDGSAVALPVLTYLGAEFVPCFTSAERLALHAGRWRQPASDPGPVSTGPVSTGPVSTGPVSTGPVSRRPVSTGPIPHIVVPAVGVARLLPPGLGLVLNPGAEASVPIYPEGIAQLAGQPGDPLAGQRNGGVRVGHPPAEPGPGGIDPGGIGTGGIGTVLAEVAGALRELPVVVSASRAWLSVPGAGEGLVLSVTLEDPTAPAAHAAVIEAVERAVGSGPYPPGYPIDVTFPGESGPDLIDVWVADNTRPFYVRDPT